MIDPRDDLAVALVDLAAGDTVPTAKDQAVALRHDVRAKHKFTLRPLAAGTRVRMYGVTVGRVTAALPAGAAITTDNLVHDVEPVVDLGGDYAWNPPALPADLPTTFAGYKDARRHQST